MSRPLAHLSALRSFESAARLNSFQRAADELNISSSAVSHNIRTLEDYLGHKLFIRQTRAISLSEAGRLLYEEVAQGFRHLEQGVERVQNIHASHIVTVSTGPAIAAKWLIPRLYSFEEQHPDVDIRLSTTNRIVDLNRREADVSIRHGTGHYDGLEATLLFSEKYAPVCTPQIADQIKTPQDLFKQRFLFDDQSLIIKTAPGWSDWFIAHGLDPKTVPKGQHFAQGDHAIQACLYGAGVLFARLSLCAPDVKEGRLIFPFQPLLSSDIGNYFVVLPGREKEPPIKAFLCWLQEEMKTFY